MANFEPAFSALHEVDELLGVDKCIMRILFIGGTRFVGLEIAREAARHGHSIDTFHRGLTKVGIVPEARYTYGDRTLDLGLLPAGNWDAIIDTCGYRPHKIDAVHRAAAGRAGKYVFVSELGRLPGGRLGERK